MNSFFRSSIGRKYLVGVTGVFLILFLVAHLLGNLQVFLGPKAINDYAAFLKSIPIPLWIARISLIVIFVAHLSTALKLKWENMQTRPKPYASENTAQASISSRIMALSGVIILLYVVGHLLHFTLGVFLPGLHEMRDGYGRPDVFLMVVKSFQIPAVALSYIFALCLLWSHLSHGISSVFQTLGFRTARNKELVDKLGPIVSTVLILGYIAIPLSILLGFVK